MLVRELPPLRLSVLATSPGGSNQRWAADEPKAVNTPSGINFSTTVSGGFESFDCQLPRKSAETSSDLERLSNICVFNAGGGIAWEGRLEKTPRQSGSNLGVNPQAVGYQAHLEDDKEATEVYVDRDLSHWGSLSAPRRLNLYIAGYGTVNDPSVEPDAATGIPALSHPLELAGTNDSGAVESLYDAGAGGTIASIYYDYTSVSSATFLGYIGVASTDSHTAEEKSADLLTGVNSSNQTTFSPTARYRYGFTQFAVAAGGAHTAGDAHLLSMRRLTVWGNHGLNKQGTAPNDGVFASDVIANAVGRWAPMLSYTTGANGTIQATSFIIPQLEFREPTTVAEIINQANRFSLNDWNVWEGSGPGRPTLYYGPRNTAAPNPKFWRARIGPAELAETGPQVDRLWNGVIVSYQDVDGTTKTVGPTDSPTDSEDASLLDTDPENPANKVGIKRYAVLDMGIVSTSDAAKQVGVQFLERAKELDHSGSAQIVGHATDDHGVVYPAHAIRAGDQISFVDSSDTSYRRIVKTSYDHDSRTNSLDLDSPPEGLDDLLERLSVSLYTGTPPPVAGVSIKPGGGWKKP